MSLTNLFRICFGSPSLGTGAFCDACPTLIKAMTSLERGPNTQDARSIPAQEDSVCDSDCGLFQSQLH